jgi:UDP-2,4-diacetamido-2,4,6-trideoxy-beta-L-altropyranose hydrolase
VKNSELSLLCTDDHGYSERWCCDAILNQNLDADLRVSYKNDLPDAKVLAGASFCLLREEFLSSQTAKRTWGRIESLLVTLGGSDSKNATEATLQLLNQSCKRPLKVRVLAGVDNPHIERLRSFESQHKIEVVQNATNMPEQYAWADGIISAGGSTCWEWLYLGLPGAIVTIADNQLPIVRALTTERRVAMPLGWFNDSKFKIRVEQLSQWLDNPQSICHQAEAQSLIDGHGADRVANELFSKNKINLEKVSNKHIELIYNWQCHPQTRRFSNNSEIPGWEEHNQWMKKKLSSKCDYFYLAVLKDSKRYCGALRLDWETTDTYVISIFLNPDFYGRGFGSDILSAVDEVHPDINIKAVVLKENAASRKLFDKVGYSKINDELYIRRKKQ